ncbi:MAG: hypothetical protein LBB62_10360, partial [Proteiniphilum sp.]|nr:hypothetical protein [Proteiniphilum sp.]
MKTTFLFIGVILVFSACDRHGKDAACHNPEFDFTELSFNAQGGTKSTTSKDSFWWMNWIYDINGESVPYDELITTRDPDTSRIIKFEGSWFTIEREADRDFKQLTFTLAPNEIGSPRV